MFGKFTARVVSAMGGGSSASSLAPAPLTHPDCPAARLAYEVRCVYCRERREGAFDEKALYAALLAFTACVFGRASSFVTCDGAAEQAVLKGAAAAASLQPRFAHEEFVRYTVRFPTLSKLLEEAQHSQLLL